MVPLVPMIFKVARMTVGPAMKMVPWCSWEPWGQPCAWWPQWWRRPWCPRMYYSATTRTVALGRRLSNPNDIWKHKILKFFGKRTNNSKFIQYNHFCAGVTDQWNSRFNWATVEIFKTVWTILTFQETALKPMNIQERSACLKSWESFVFRNRCDWRIFFQVPWFNWSHCKSSYGWE